MAATRPADSSQAPSSPLLPQSPIGKTSESSKEIAHALITCAQNVEKIRQELESLEAADIADVAQRIEVTLRKYRISMEQLFALSRFTDSTNVAEQAIGIMKTQLLNQLTDLEEPLKSLATRVIDLHIRICQAMIEQNLVVINAWRAEKASELKEKAEEAVSSLHGSVSNLYSQITQLTSSSCFLMLEHQEAQLTQLDALRVELNKQLSENL